jgi:hypothetical protein
MNRTSTFAFLRPIGDLGRLRRTGSAVGQRSLSIEGVGLSASEAEGARRGALGAAPDPANETAGSATAKRQDARTPTPINAASDLDRTTARKRSRSAATPGRGSEPATPLAAKRQDASTPTPIYGAFALDRAVSSLASRSATTPGPKRERRALPALALAIGLALGLGASPAQAQAKGDAGQVLKEYGAMYEALVTNKTEGVAASAAKIAEVAGACAKSGATAKECGALAAAAKKVVGKDLESLRAQFKELSVAADGYLRAVEAPGWDLYFCPMADGYWIQTAEGVRNPYYGPSMLKCGEKVPGVAKS